MTPDERRPEGDFTYAQARLQARHGRRPGPSQWAQLYSSATIGHFLQSARATGLERWVADIDVAAEPHEVERWLRDDLRRYVDEVASWVPGSWRPAVRWSSTLMELQALDALLDDGAVPSWVAHDTQLGPLAGQSRAERVEAISCSRYGPLEGGAPGSSARARWLGHWRALWPTMSRSHRRALEAVVERVGRHARQMAQVEDTRDGWALREQLEAELRGHFRRHREQPAAVFTHLLLVALDLERLRGAILRRALFPQVRSRGRWV